MRQVMISILLISILLLIPVVQAAAPDLPSVNNPANGATNQPVSVSLNVTVTDPDSDPMNISFYNASSGAQIGTTQYDIASGSTANVTWAGLDYDTLYSWYANATNDTDTTQSSTWSFTTKVAELTVLASDIGTGSTINNYTVNLSTGQSGSTTTGTITFEHDVDQSITITVNSSGYYSKQTTITFTGDITETLLLSSLEGTGTGTYYPPRVVEFIVVDVWGNALANIDVNVTGYETTVVSQSWWERLFGINPTVEVYGVTMSGTTDDAGQINFFMVETIKYEMYFVNTTQGIDAYRTIYPKEDVYVITIGNIPSEGIGYWVTTNQSNETNTGNITLHYADYNSPVETNWVNFSLYYYENDTYIYHYNFTTISQVNSHTTPNVNASHGYRIRMTVNHDDMGTFTQYITVNFVVPERARIPAVQYLNDNLEDWQVTMIGAFILFLFMFIFGAVDSGIGGLAVSVIAIGFHFFGMFPSISTTAAYILFPTIALMSVMNLYTQRQGVAVD